MIGGFQYGTSTSFGLALANLASSATVGLASAAIDNSVAKFVDVFVQIRFKLLTGVPSLDQNVYIYLYGSEDGTSYPDGITGTAGSYTFRNPANLTYLQGTAIAVTGQLVCNSQPVSVGLAFNGVMPRKWGIVIRNYTGLAFTATAGDHDARYTGVQIVNT